MEQSNNRQSQDDDSSTTQRRRFWEQELENKKEGKILEENKMLENFIGKKIKVWSAFTDSCGGWRGKYMGTAGVLKAVDSEFICLNDHIFLSRKFILRFELV